MDIHYLVLAIIVFIIVSAILYKVETKPVDKRFRLPWSKFKIKGE